MDTESFTPNKPRYDQSKLTGRIKHFFEIFNPFLLTISNYKLASSVELLKRFKEGKIQKLNKKIVEELWEAKKITDAVLHPQTKEKIPLPFRFSAFTLMNIPIVAGMISVKTIPGQLFWQWYNQSYNVAVNHCNGNKTNPLPPKKIASAYLLALTVSCGMSIGLQRLVTPARRLSRALGLFARCTVPFVAVSSAGVANVLLMRRNEAVKGIEVKDRDGRVVGISKKAARTALQQVALTRAFFPLPTLLLPAMIKAVVDHKQIFASRPRLYLPFNIAVVAGLIFVSLPMTIGMFPQEGSAKVESLESQFRNLILKDGSPVKEVYFNKGL